MKQPLFLLLILSLSGCARGPLYNQMSEVPAVVIKKVTALHIRNTLCDPALILTFSLTEPR